MTTEMPTIFQDAGLDNLTLEFVYHALLSPLWPYRFGEANKAQDITLRESLGVDSLVLCKLRLKSKDCFGNTSLTTVCRVSTLSLWRNILLFCLLVRKFVCLLLRKNLLEKKNALDLNQRFWYFLLLAFCRQKTSSWSFHSGCAILSQVDYAFLTCF